MSSALQAKRLHDALILVVDDVEVNRKVLTQSLLAHGYRNVISADDGASALEATSEKKPDLVVLDLMMPGMDGFAYCQKIRADKAYEHMPIIVQTALNEMEQKLKAFQLGANDYICKPIDPGELSARAQVHLNQKLLMEDLRTYQKNMIAELDVARKMQDRLLPTQHQVEMCERVFDLKIASHFEPSSTLGGDCWGIRPLSDYQLGVYMFDFSGRGVASAMNVFRMHTMLQEFPLESVDPARFLLKLNQHLYPMLGRDELATMFYGIIDTEANCLSYASAAVPPAMVFPAGGKTPMTLSGRGFPLGVSRQVGYETQHVPFGRGDLLLLHSDCMIETPNDKGELISEERIRDEVRETLRAEPKNHAQAAVERLVKLLREHNPAPVRDDHTITTYWRCPPAT